MCVCQRVHCVHGIQQPLTYGRSQWLGHYRDYSYVVQKLFGFKIIDGESDCEGDIFSWPGIVTVNDSDISNWKVADSYFPVSVADAALDLIVTSQVYNNLVCKCLRVSVNVLRFPNRLVQWCRSRNARLLGNFMLGLPDGLLQIILHPASCCHVKGVVAFPGVFRWLWIKKKWMHKHVLSSAMFEIFLDISGYLYSSCILLWRFRCFTVNLGFLEGWQRSFSVKWQGFVRDVREYLSD